MSSSDDIFDLIDGAGESGNKGSNADHHRRGSGGFSLLGRIIVMALVPISLYAVVNQFAADGLSDIVVETQLINILHSAENSLRDATTNGEPLPPVLPNAALASIVDYHVQDGDYILIAEANGIRVVVNSHGGQTVYYDND